MIVNQTFIAKKSGVSQKTVSLYFKDKALVGEKVRERIDEVVRKYDYLPNLAARAMKSDRFHRVSCVLVQYGSVEMTIQAQLMSYLNGASAELSKAGYSLAIEPVFVDFQNRKATFSEFFSMRSADGIIGISGGWVPAEVDERIARLQLPTVWLNRDSDSPEIRSIVFDERPALAGMARKFAADGIRHVCWVGPEYRSGSVHYSRRTRYEMVKAELEARGASCDGIFFDSAREESIRAAVHELFRRAGEFDAFFFYSFYYLERALWMAAAGEFDRSRFRLGYFVSEGEFGTHKCDFSGGILLPESELGRRGAEYILSCLEGEPDAGLLRPFPCRFPGAES